jgi:hypothetical protein
MENAYSRALQLALVIKVEPPACPDTIPPEGGTSWQICLE